MLPIDKAAPALNLDGSKALHSRTSDDNFDVDNFFASTSSTRTQLRPSQCIYASV